MRTDTELLDGLQNLPDQLVIIYERGAAKRAEGLNLREQINKFLDREQNKPDQKTFIQPDTK